MTKFYPSRYDKSKGVWIEDGWLIIDLHDMSGGIKGKVQIQQISGIVLDVIFRVYFLFIVFRFVFNYSIHFTNKDNKPLLSLPIGALSNKDMYDVIAEVKAQNQNIQFDEPVEKFTKEKNTGLINAITVQGIKELVLGLLILALNVLVIMSPLLIIALVNEFKGV